MNIKSEYKVFNVKKNDIKEGVSYVTNVIFERFTMFLIFFLLLLIRIIRPYVYCVKDKPDFHDANINYILELNV